MINPKYDSNFTVERAVPGIFYWKVDNYTISYDLNGGSSINQPIKSYNVDSSTIKLEVPTRSNYVFIGWKDTETNSYVSTIPSGSFGNKSFKADWKKDATLSVSTDTYYITNNVLEVPYTYNGNGNVSCSSTNDSFTCEIINNKVKITSNTTGQTIINLKSSETNDYVSKSTSFAVINRIKTSNNPSNQNPINNNANTDNNHIIDNTDNDKANENNNFLNFKKSFIVVFSILVGISLIFIVLKKKDYYN